MDLSDVIESFFAESLEGLELMENGLLAMQPGAVEPETINTIFRAAHSIKGGGGIFGFSEISDFMHGVEALLDQLRSGQREFSEELSTLLLETIDCARHMFETTRNKQPQQQDKIDALQERIEQTLNQIPPAEPYIPYESEKQLSSRWYISFRPHSGMLAKANDPLRMMRELADLGPLTSRVHIDNLPAFADIEPTECYLRWDIELESAIPKEEIEEIFAWVLDECDLTIQQQETEDHRQEATEQPQDTAVPEPVAITSEATDHVPADNGTHHNGATATPESIRVSIDKIDDLINLVGELVITQSMLCRFGTDISAVDPEALREGLSALIRNTRDLQESVLQIRMLPIRFCFNRFPRLVHDISQKLGKRVNLKLSGVETELDKTVLERINDPLVHLVRNSLDHGLESPEQRRIAGKPETGMLELKAYHASGNIVIEVIDDGQGLNTEKIKLLALQRGLISEDEKLNTHQLNNLIFQPGFTTVETVSDLSGRGVGMDVVKRNINDLGGDVWIESEPGTGTKVLIRLPLTLAILDGQLLRVGNEIYILPLSAIIETLQIDPNRVNTLPGGSQVYRLRDQHIPIIRLDKAFNTLAQAEQLEQGLLIIVDSERQRYGIWVDELLDQQQVVIKSLVSNFKQVCGISGATILGDGTVALILDVTGIVLTFSKQSLKPGLAVA